MSSPYRRTDGTFGIDGEVSSKITPRGTGHAGNGRPFPKGNKLGGRPKGRPNKVKAELAELSAEIPVSGSVAVSDGLPGDGRTREPLQVLEWAMLHPRASLGLIVLAADKLASYKHAKKTDNRTTIVADDEAAMQQLLLGRQRVAAMKQERSLNESQETEQTDASRA